MPVETVGRVFRTVGILGAKALGNELVCGVFRQTWAFLLIIVGGCVKVRGER